MIRFFQRQKKYSLFTLVLIAVTVGTIVYVPMSLVLDFYDRVDEFTVQREKRLTQYLGISQSLYRAGADQDLTALLKEVRDQGDISYFVIYKQGELAYAEPSDNALAAGHTFEQRAPTAGQDLIDESRSERSEFLSDDILLTIGIDKRKSVIFDVIFGTTIWKGVLQDIFSIIAMAAFAFWVHTRDLTRLKKEITRFGRVTSDVNPKRSLSAEAEAIVAGFQGYAYSEKNLKDKSDRLSAQVLPALKRELFSGKAPPYTFNCTLVRTDINGFSQIFNSPYRDRFAKHIDDFFIGLTEIVSRYEGLIYEFVGDEAIFYFKDFVEEDYQVEDQLGPSTSINRALDAVRDIHLLASDINTRTQLEGHRFTVKSAFAHGTLRFGQQVDGFSLSGGVLIETVRILSTVTDKAESHLYFASRHTPYLRDDIQTEKVGLFSLKGYSEDVALVRWLSSTPLSHHIANVASESGLNTKFDFVSQHRSDFSLETIISSAAAARDGWSLQDHLRLVHALRTINVYKPHHPLGETINDWLRSARALAPLNPEWHRLVSAILMIFPNLVPKSALTEKDILELEKLLDSDDARTVANTISVLTLYQVESKVRPLTALFASENNRIAANAIIHEGSRELSDSILTKLDQMIFSNDEARRASGLYALGEIARLLRSRDPVYYSTRIDFHKLVARIQNFTTSTNESVATQATRALAKAEIATETFSAAA